MKSRNIWMIAILLFLPGLLLAQKTTDKKNRSLLDIKINRVFDLYYWLRKEASSDSNSKSQIVGFAEAVNETRQLQKDFGGALSPVWSLLDASLVECENTSEAIRLFSELPETTKFRGKEVPVREGAGRLAKAMNAIETQFLKSAWKRRKKMIRNAVSNINKTLKPKEREWLAYITKNLDLTEPQKPLAIYFVTESPPPGAATFFLKDGGMLIVIDLSNKDSLLYETVLHETIHALEGMPDKEKIADPAMKKSVFAELEERLEEASVSERDRSFAAHLLVFAQAAATVKHFLDPQHQPYGEVKTVYARLSFIAPFVVPVWNEYLEGKISREQALTQIVEGVARKEEKRQSSR